MVDSNALSKPCELVNLAILEEAKADASGGLWMGG
jgi:hypothetical protein